MSLNRESTFLAIHDVILYFQEGRFQKGMDLLYAIHDELNDDVLVQQREQVVEEQGQYAAFQ